jgi:hypothetical protein
MMKSISRVFLVLGASTLSYSLSTAATVSGGLEPRNCGGAGVFCPSVTRSR